jgi:hypothetical protein
LSETLTQRRGIPAINKALAIIGIAVIALGFWSVTIRVGTNTIKVGSQSFTAGNYPYFTLGAIIVLVGMGFIASGLIYSPQKLSADLKD